MLGKPRTKKQKKLGKCFGLNQFWLKFNFLLCSKLVFFFFFPAFIFSFPFSSNHFMFDKKPWWINLATKEETSSTMLVSTWLLPDVASAVEPWSKMCSNPVKIKFSLLQYFHTGRGGESKGASGDSLEPWNDRNLFKKVISLPGMTECGREIFFLLLLTFFCAWEK